MHDDAKCAFAVGTCVPREAIASAERNASSAGVPASSANNLVARVLIALVLAICNSAQAEMYISSFADRSVFKFDERSGIGGMIVPESPDTKLGLVVGRDGHLYIAGSAGVTRHDARTGALLKTFEPLPPPPHPFVPFRVANAMAEGPDHRLYVVDLTGEVLRYDAATGTFIDIFVPFSSLGNEPHGIAFDPDGGSLLISTDFVSRVRRYSAADGSFLGFFGPDHGTHSGQIAFGSDGNLYVAELLSNQITRYDGASGASLGVFASGGGMTAPFALGFGPDGNLYVGSGGDDRVYVYDGSTGGLMRSFAAGGLDLGYFTYFAFSSPIPEPEQYALWLAALSFIAVRYRRTSLKHRPTSPVAVG